MQLSDVFNFVPQVAEGAAMPTFTVTVTFTADQNDEHLRDEQAIRDEARSWFESLRATVHTVTVRREDK